MMVNALAACDRILVPVQTEFLALKGLERMMKTFRDHAALQAGEVPLHHHSDHV